MKKITVDNEFLMLATSPTSPIIKTDPLSNILHKPKKKHWETSIKQQILSSRISDKVHLIKNEDEESVKRNISQSGQEDSQGFLKNLKIDKIKPSLNVESIISTSKSPIKKDDTKKLRNNKAFIIIIDRFYFYIC